MIEPVDIHVSHEGAARRVLMHVATFAPCILTLDGDAKVNALAILNPIAQEMERAASRQPGVKRRSAGPWLVEYFSPAELGRAFSPLDRASLLALCGQSATHGGPVGAFPAPRSMSHIFGAE